MQVVPNFWMLRGLTKIGFPKLTSSSMATLSVFGCVLLASHALADIAIVDGDTFDVDGIRIRINGIDAPEYGQKCGSIDCGADALAALNNLIHSGSIDCEELGEDGYGRVIGRCFVAGQDIGAKLVSDGYAYAFTKYSMDYVVEEESARSRGVGVWSGDYQRPWDFRAEKWENSQQNAPNGCPIKGNISENGKIYHAPWSPWYAKTRINEAKGERWFCSEAEAVSAGWRAPRWR